MQRLFGTISLRLLLISCAFLIAVSPVQAKPPVQGGAGSGGGGTAGTSPAADKGVPQSGAPESRGSTENRGEFSEASLREMQALEAWFKSSADARYLQAIFPSVMRQAAECAKAGVSPQLILSRLREAAAKKVPLTQVESGIELDIRNWIFLAGAVSADSWLPSRARDAFFLSLGTAMRNGFSQSAASDAIHWARTEKIRADRLALAVASVTGLPVSKENLSALWLRLLKSLAGSRLRTEQFPEVVSLVQQSVLRGSAVEVSMKTVEGILASGATIADIKASLNR